MAKGSEFERNISKKLSLWWSYGERNDIFYRTAGSGARATVRMKNKQCTAYSAGDIGCIDPKGIPFLDLCLVEIKRGYGEKFKITTNKKTGKQKINKGSGIDTLLFVDKPIWQKENILFQWWLKADEERKQHKRKYVIIIFKRDAKEPCIMLSKKFYKEVLSHKARWKISNPKMTINYKRSHLIIINLDDFFKWCTPKVFYQIGEQNDKKH